jgi:probable rRNA maturation factor
VALATLPSSLSKAAALGQMTVLLTHDREVQALNLDFRGKDKPTNVLSFPGFERPDLLRAARAGAPLYAGDIAVAYAFTSREAKAEGKKLLDHVTHLTIHGILHLYGYDHDTPARARVMEKLEKQIMATLGLPDPYAPISEPVRARRGQ